MSEVPRFRPPRRSFYRSTPSSLGDEVAGSGPWRGLAVAVELPWLVAYVSLALVFWTLCADVQLLGEDRLHLNRLARWSGPLAAFDRELIPARPLQWLAMWTWHRLLPDGLSTIRMVTIGLHALLLCGVHVWLRRRGVSVSGTLLAVVLLAVAPVQAHLVWLTASMYSLRALLAFAAGVLWWSYIGRRSDLRGLTVALLFLLCLLAHEAAIIMAVGFGAAWLLREGRRGLRLALTDRWTWILGALALWRVLDVWLWRPDMQYAIKSSPAVTSNLARSAFNFVPCLAREPLLDWLRGTYGTVAQFGGVAVFVLVVGLLVYAVWKGSRLQRYLLGMGLLEQLPPILFVGVTVRYLHVSLAFLVAAIGLAFLRITGARRAVLTAVVVLLCLGSLQESIATTRAIRGADVAATRIAQDARSERERVGEGVTIAVADVPEYWGGSNEVSFMPWGLRAFLRHQGVSEPIEVLRTTAPLGSTSARRITGDELRRRAARPDYVVLRFDRDQARLLRLQ